LVPPGRALSMQAMLKLKALPWSSTAFIPLTERRRPEALANSLLISAGGEQPDTNRECKYIFAP